MFKIEQRLDSNWLYEDNTDEMPSTSKLKLALHSTRQAKQFINEFVNKEYCKENLRLTNQYKRYPHKCNHKEFVIGLIKVIEDNSKEYQTQGDWYAVRTLVEKYVFDFHEGCLHWHNLSEYTQDIIKTLAKSITYLSAYNNYKRDIVESLSKKNPLESRFLNRFRPQYSNAFDSVLNKNGKAIEGSSLDSRSGLNVSVDHETDWKTYLSTPKVEGVRVPNFTWFLSMSYYGNYFKIKLPKNWRKDVALNNIAVVDKKIITDVLEVKEETLNNIPITIYKVEYCERSQKYKGSRDTRNSTITTGLKGYVVKVGDKDNPIALRLSQHISHVRVMAENSTAKAFFQQLEEVA